MGKCVFTVCGPKCSLCCLVLSVWGVIMLGLLGVFFKVEAVALFEDIEPALKECDDNGCKGFLPGVKYYDQKDVADAYAGAAYSCWGAATLYLFFMILSGTFVGINFWRAKAAAQS